MNCPKCDGQELQQRLGSAGLLVETCASCRGLWLEKGELYHYVSDAKRLYEDLAAAYGKVVECSRPCPRCAVKMVQARLPAPGPVLDVCPKCGGTWLDAGELEAVRSLLDKEIAAERGAHPSVAPVQASPAEPTASPAYARMAAAGLTALPSLALRSATVLVSLYAVLCGFSFLVVALWKLPLGYVFLGSSVALVLSFLLGPWLHDLGLQWAHAFHWADPDDLPDHLRRFVNRVCRERGIPFPRCGIVEDENPNAYTYGHYPGDARLILTQGVLDMLGDAELEAVVGHEIGHVVHWDMLVMTVAALVPMLLYAVYKGCMRATRRSSSRDKGKGGVLLVGLVALALYYVTEYVVLFLSRTRELYADRFSGEITRDPNSLASALVKIAYGLAGHRSEKEDEGSAGHETMRALGIFDPVGAVGLVAASMTQKGAPSKESILGAMQWDLWNPWATYYELQSTHPLPAHRLEYLGQQASAYGQTPFVTFDREKPESYWEDFFVDCLFLWMPGLLPAAYTAWGLVHRMTGDRFFWGVPAAWALGNILKICFSYQTDSYADTTVSALLKKIKVSKVREVPSKLRGTIIGRGIPGYIVSEHMVLQDQTGFIFLDYQQPLAIFQWIFAISRVPELIGRKVEASGWYRRAPVPYLELRRLVVDGRTSTCYGLEGQYFVAMIVLGFSLWKMLP